MKQEIITNLNSVINTLNHMEVMGKERLLMLGGSIAVIEECCQRIAFLADPEPVQEDAPDITE